MPFFLISIHLLKSLHFLICCWVGCPILLLIATLLYGLHIHKLNIAEFNSLSKKII